MSIIISTIINLEAERTSLIQQLNLFDRFNLSTNARIKKSDWKDTTFETVATIKRYIINCDEAISILRGTA
jgi:hypothetical protein